jgi:hypothetical protein
MDGFVEIERRIDSLYSRAASVPVHEELAADIEDLLEEGYICALEADARVRRMRARLDELASGVRQPDAGDEAWRLMCETRQVEKATRRLRARLGTVETLAARSAAARAGSG